MTFLAMLIMSSLILPWITIIFGPILVLLLGLSLLLYPLLQNIRKSLRPLALIIDDDETAISYMRSILEVKGYKVVSFFDPRKGLEYLLRNKWNILAVDYDMPYLKGDEIIDSLSKKHFDEKKQFFYFTGKNLKINKTHSPQLDFIGVWDKKLGVNHEILAKIAA